MPGRTSVVSNNQYIERSTIIDQYIEKLKTFNNNIPDDLALTLVNDMNKLQTKTTNPIQDHEHIRRINMSMRLKKKLMERRNKTI